MHKPPLAVVLIVAVVGGGAVGCSSPSSSSPERPAVEITESADPAPTAGAGSPPADAGVLATYGDPENQRRWYVQKTAAGLQVGRPGWFFDFIIGCMRDAPTIVLSLKGGIFHNGDVRVRWDGDYRTPRAQYMFLDMNDTLTAAFQPWTKDLVAQLSRHEFAEVHATKFPNEPVSERLPLEGVDEALAHLPCL